MAYPYSDDEIALEPFFNNGPMVELDGTKKNLRVVDMSNPIPGYQISDQEVGATSYYGYENMDGLWYIQKVVVTGTETSYRYRKGSSGYATAWTGRAAGPAYDYFEDAF